MANELTSRRFQSWPASLLLFTIASAAEFGALAGWYVSHSGDPRLPWAFFHTPHKFLALVPLLVGFLIERAAVVAWLRVPSRVMTPSGNLTSLWLMLAGVTVAEIAAWTVWIELSEAGEPWFGALVLAVGIHLVHAYEVAVLQHRDLKSVLCQGGVMMLTGLEWGGGVWALWLAVRGHVWCPLLVLLGALVLEHLMQVMALKAEAQSA